MSAAEETFESYWVLGSFASEQKARQALETLQPRVGDTLKIARFNRSGEAWFRVVLAKFGDTTGQKRKLEVLNIEAWTTNIATSQLLADTASSGMMTSGMMTSSEEFLVIGSYQTRRRAEQGLEQLIASTDNPLTIREAQVNGKTAYRLVSGPYRSRDVDIRQGFENMGLSGTWWISLKEDTAMMAKKVVPETMPRKPAAESVGDRETSGTNSSRETSRRTTRNQPKPVIPIAPQVRVPRSDESYFDYCVRKANSKEREMFCTDGKFESQVIYQWQKFQQLSDRERLVYCAQEAKASDRIRLCRGNVVSGTR